MSRLRNVLVLLLLSALIAPAAAVAHAEEGGETDALEVLEAAEELLEEGAVASAAPEAPEGREGTLVLRDLAKVLPRLRGPARARAERILARPDKPGGLIYFGEEAPGSPRCDARFCVHWASGEHAPPSSDFVQEVQEAATHSYAVQNGELGWRDAVSDGARGSRGGRGRNGQVDIYLANLPKRLFGVAITDPGQTGRSRSAYLVIDNDFSSFGGEPLSLMRATIAHEYNHVLQYAYDSHQDDWMFESTATWAEDRVFPEINDYLAFLAPFARYPQHPMAERNGTRRGPVKVYGSAAWAHWLDTRRGAETIRRAWEVSPAVKPKSLATSAYDRSIRERGGPGFSEEFAAFAATTAEWAASPAFPDSALHPDVRRERGPLKAKRRGMRLDHTAYALFNVKRGGDRRLVVRGQRGARSALALVGRTGPRTSGEVEVALRYLPKGGRGKVKLADTGRFSRLTAVVVNADGRGKAGGRRYLRDHVRYLAKVRRLK